MFQLVHACLQATRRYFLHLLVTSEFMGFFDTHLQADNV